MRARMIPVESFYQGGDTEAKAKETVITAAYECFKASQAWQERYREGGQAVMNQCPLSHDGICRCGLFIFRKQCYDY